MRSIGAKGQCWPTACPGHLNVSSAHDVPGSHLGSHRRPASGDPRPHPAAAAGSPAEAVPGARVVMTMLADGPATAQAANGPDGFLAPAAGAIWVQMATIGTEWTTVLAGIAGEHGVTYVDAPVSGSEGPARAGQLTILAS